MSKTSDRPVEGQIYRLTGGPEDPSIAAGNTWSESVVDPIADEARRLAEDDGIDPDACGLETCDSCGRPKTALPIDDSDPEAPVLCFSCLALAEEESR